MLKQTSPVNGKFSANPIFLNCLLAFSSLGISSTANAVVSNYQDAQDADVTVATHVYGPDNPLKQGSLTDNGKTYATLVEGTGLDIVLNSTLHREGTHSFQFTAAASTPTSPGKKERSELALVNDIDFTTTKFSGFSFRLSGSRFGPVANDSGDFLIIHQWHQNANKDDPNDPNNLPGRAKESPPISLRIKPDAAGTGNQLKVNFRQGVRAADHTQFELPATEISIPKGQWIDVITKWRVNPSTTTGTATTGIFRMFLRIPPATGYTTVVDYTGPIGYTGLTDKLINERFGIYSSRQAQGVEHQLHYDEIRSGDFYSDVDIPL